MNRDYNGVRFYEKLEQAGYSTVLVKRTSDVWASIDSTRTLLRHAIIHARYEGGVFIWCGCVGGGVDCQGVGVAG